MDRLKLDELIKKATYSFLCSGAEDDIAIAEAVYLTGELSLEQYCAAVLLRKVYSILLLSSARSGLIPAIDENSIPYLYDETCDESAKYEAAVLPHRSEFGLWQLFDDRVIESFVMPVIKKYGWEEVFLLQEYDEENMPVPVVFWLHNELGALSAEESDFEGLVRIPEKSMFAAIAYHNALFSRIMFLCKHLEERGLHLDFLLDEEMLGVLQQIAGFVFVPVTLPYFSINRIWDGENYYHVALTRSVSQEDSYGNFLSLEGYSYYKYADPSLIFLLPELDAGMRKLLPVLEELVRKEETGELASLRTAA